VGKSDGTTEVRKKVRKKKNIHRSKFKRPWFFGPCTIFAGSREPLFTIFGKYIADGSARVKLN
jgi:hypothetical protein